jgi:hypothetical protein
MKTSATEPIAMELDNITADSPALENLMDYRISAKEKKIDKMISRLINQVNSAAQNKPEQGRSFRCPSKKDNRKAKRQKKRPKSRCCHQRYQQKPAKERKKQVDAKALEFEEERLVSPLRVTKAIKHTYGFVSDPTSGNNLAIQLTQTPSYLISSRPKNLACHNLFTILSPLKNYQSLLGLGLKFCPTPPHTTGPKQFENTSDRFRKHIHTQMLFAGFDNDWSPTQLFTSREDWEPDINELPREFCSRVNSFLKASPPCPTLLATNSNYSKAYKTPKNSLYYLRIKTLDPASSNGPNTSKPPWTVYLTRPPTNDLNPTMRYNQSSASNKISSNFLNIFLWGSIKVKDK